MTLGSRLKEARKSRGWSQAVFAELLGIEQKTVSNYETGKTRPAIDEVEGIATTLGVDPAWLAFGSQQNGRRPEPGSLTEALRRLNDAEEALAEVRRQLEAFFPNAQKKRTVAAGKGRRSKPIGEDLAPADWQPRGEESSSIPKDIHS